MYYYIIVLCILTFFCLIKEDLIGYIMETCQPKEKNENEWKQ